MFPSSHGFFSPATLLQNAVLSGNAQEVRRLLSSGINVSAKGYDGSTALHLAVQLGLRPMVSLLLSSGVNASAQNAAGMTALGIAVSQGRIGIVEDILPHVDINASVGEGSLAALHVAAFAGQEAIARLLLAKGASVSRTDDFRWTPLHRAAGAGQISIMKLFLEHGADLFAVSAQGSTLLQIAAEGRQKASIEFVLDKGVDVNFRDKTGATVLHRTAYTSGDIEIGKLLLQRGADIDGTDDKGGTPLHSAVAYMKHDFVRFLLEQEADVNAVDKNGIIPLHLALQLGSGDQQLLELLLSNGADVNLSDKITGDSPLHIAVVTGQNGAARLLLKRGAAVNGQAAKSGRTALSAAVLHGNVSMINLLLENNADILIKDKEGLCPLSISEVLGNKDVSKTLLESIPGTTHLVEEIVGQAEDKASSDLESELAKLSIGLSHLCGVCSSMNFPSLHDESSCTEAGCNYQDTLKERPFNRAMLQYHSKPYNHYESIQQLETSAQEGCHLCSLMSFALHNSYEFISSEGRSSIGGGMNGAQFGPVQSSGIILVYHKCGKAPFKKEELEVFNGKRFALLSIANVPPKRCSDNDFSEAEWDGSLDEPKTEAGLWKIGDAKALFYARCVKPNHPAWGHKKMAEMDGGRLGGYLRIQSYMPGQIVSVYAVRGKFWLASLVNGIPAALEAHHAGHATFGWIDSEDYIRLTTQPHPSCDCGKGVWEPPLLSTIGGGQTAYLSLNPLSAMPLIKHWISSCDSGHKMCKPVGDITLPLRVIDVGIPGANGQYPDPVLTEGRGRQGRYATLSYRWGNMIYITTNSNISERKAGMPFASMPPTFQDVIQVTRKVGLRYLWIDALCITQDSARDWQEQSALMGHIYSKAWLNISVSATSEPQGGFLTLRNPLEIQSCRHETFFGDSTKVPKVICPSIPRHDRLLDRDVLNSRGWILQERVLSRRTLHFGSYEIFWDCLSSSASEREPDRFELWSNASDFDKESQDRRKYLGFLRHGVQYLVNQKSEELLDLFGPEGFSVPCHDEGYSRWVLRNLSKDPKERTCFQRPCAHYHPLVNYAPPSVTVGQFVAAHHLWYCLVQEYSIRNLTEMRDKLPALSGLAGMFARVLGTRSKYVAGLWSGCILDGLTWTQARAMMPSPSRPLLRGALPCPATYRAPSFSWASVEGAVYFSMPQRNRLVGDQTYEAEVLSSNCQPTSDADPFGQVSSASLKLKAKVIPFQRLCEETDYIPILSDFDVRDEVPDPSNDSILCLSLRSVSRGYLGEPPEIVRQCLLLLPVDEAKGVYRRVGYFSSRVPQPPRPFVVQGVDFSDMFKGLGEPRRTLITPRLPMMGGRRKLLRLSNVVDPMRLPISTGL